MSDWDILAPVEDGDNQGDQENDADDGVFFGDGGVDNDSFAGSSGHNQIDHDDVEYNAGYSDFMGKEAQSFNPRMCDHSKQKDFLAIEKMIMKKCCLSNSKENGSHNLKARFIVRLKQTFTKICPTHIQAERFMTHLNSHRSNLLSVEGVKGVLVEVTA